MIEIIIENSITSVPASGDAPRDETNYRYFAINWIYTHNPNGEFSFSCASYVIWLFLKRPESRLSRNHDYVVASVHIY
jgi:hypothetical protein